MAWVRFAPCQLKVLRSYQTEEGEIVAKDALVPEEMARKFATEKDTPYAR